LSRASRALLAGHWGEAFHLHPLVYLILPTLGVYVAGQAFSYVVSRQTWVHRAVNSQWLERAMIVLMALALALWISRFFGAFGGPVPV